jgi:hypothetical protein
MKVPEHKGEVNNQNCLLILFGVISTHQDVNMLTYWVGRRKIKEKQRLS